MKEYMGWQTAALSGRLNNDIPLPRVYYTNRREALVVSRKMFELTSKEWGWTAVDELCTIRGAISSFQHGQ